MSGKKGQKHYPEAIREEILRRLTLGENQRQICRELGISRYAIQDWDKGKISTAEALQLCNMSDSTFYRRRREYHITRK